MLCLAVAKDESILIGDRIRVTLLARDEDALGVFARVAIMIDVLRIELTMREQDCVYISPDIRVAFIRTMGATRVVIGSYAPSGVAIDRESVRISKDKRRAAI